MRLLGVLGASEALGDHLVRHPAHWRELTDPPWARPGRRRTPSAAGCSRAVGADPAGPDPDRRHARRGGARRPARGVPPRAAAPGRARPRPPPRRRRRGRRARRPRGRHPRRRPGRGPAAGRCAGGDGPAGGGRDGQVRRPRAQLRLRRGRHLRGRAAACRRHGRDRRPARRDAAGLPPGADLRRAHRRGHDLGGRRRAAARGEGGPARADAGEPSRLLRALGEDVGVPGAAEGPPGRRRPRPRRGVRRRWSRPWCGALPERDGFVGDVQAMRRRVLDHIPAREAERQLKLGSGRAARRGVRRAAAPARARPRRREPAAERPP